METSKAEITRQAESDELISLKQQVASLTDSLHGLQAQFAEQSKVLADLISRMSGVTAAAPSQPETQPETTINAEILVVIAAAVTAFLGKKVQIRSAKMLQSPYEIVNPWAQQGRVIVQASHFLRRT